MNPKLVVITLALLTAGPLHAADLFYKKSLSLYVIHNVDKGKSDSRQLDTAVGKYAADAGAVVYLKGQTLYLIRNTRDPKPVILENGVVDFEFKDGLIAYTRDDSLYVRRLSEDAHQMSRRVLGSRGVSSIEVAHGTVVFLKNQATLYRVTDCDQGTADRVIYPVGQVQLSGAR